MPPCGTRSCLNSRLPRFPLQAVEAQANLLGRDTDNSFAEVHKRTDSLVTEVQVCKEQLARDRESAEAASSRTESRLTLCNRAILPRT